MTFKNFVVNEEVHKNNINKIDIFDFDDTIIYPPSSEKAKEMIVRFNLRRQLKNQPEIKWDENKPYWYNPQSMEPPILPKPCPCSLLNQGVAHTFYKSARNPKILTLVMTGRPPGLEKQVRRVLNDFKMTPDRLYLMPEEGFVLDHKIQHLAKLLDEFPHVMEIEMWDDRGPTKAKLMGSPRENHCKEFKHFLNKCHNMRQDEDSAWELKFKINEIPPRDNEAVEELKRQHPDYKKK